MRSEGGRGPIILPVQIPTAPALQSRLAQSMRPSHRGERSCSPTRKETTNDEAHRHHHGSGVRIDDPDRLGHPRAGVPRGRLGPGDAIEGGGHAERSRAKGTQRREHALRARDSGYGASQMKRAAMLVKEADTACQAGNTAEAAQKAK